MGMGNTDRETVKISMTVTEETREWVEKTYPEAQSTQEGIRMAISDARKHCSTLSKANVEIGEKSN